LVPLEPCAIDIVVTEGEKVRVGAVRVTPNVNAWLAE
jgi:hypothetical protein